MISFTCKKNDQQKFWIAIGYSVKLHKFLAMKSSKNILINLDLFW